MKVGLIMRKEELKIGNYFTEVEGETDLNSGWVHKISQIRDEWILDDINDFRHLNDIYPITPTENHLIDLGFEIIRYVEPKQSTGTDLFHGYDYAVKKIGVKTYLTIRFQDGKYKLEGFYSKTFTGLHEIQNLISILS